MASTASALKRNRQSEKARQRNKSVKSNMKTFIKKYAQAVASGDVDAAEKALKESTTLIHRAAANKVIHRNQAARRVSRMTKRLNLLKAGQQA